MTDTTPTSSATVSLEYPIMLGDTEVNELTLTKPKSGALRGLKLNDIMNSDVNAMRTLIPRICSPVITEHHVDDMDPSDFAQVVGEIIAFFMGKATMEAISEHLGADIRRK